MGRIFNKGEKPHFVYDQFMGASKYNQYFYVRPGVIEEIDYDKYEMTVRWVPNNKGFRNKVPISFPYAGPSGIIGMLPEKGAIGIFAFMNARDKEFDFNVIDIPKKCKLVTAIIRNDRFCEGALISAFESGLILKILKSIKLQIESN